MSLVSRRGRDNGRDPKTAREADGEGAAVERPRAELPDDGALIDLRRIGPQRESEADGRDDRSDQHPDRPHRECGARADARTEHGRRQED